MAEQTEVLAQAPKPFGPITTSAQAYEAQRQLIPEVAQAEADVKKAEAEVETFRLGERAKAAEDYATKVRGETARTQKMLNESPFPQFEPTKENAQSLGELFSLTATFGLLLGNMGKTSSLGAMNAMTGMLGGWRQGRMDLFNKEKAEFDKNLGVMKAKHEEYKKDLEQYLKLAATDRDAANAKADEMAAKLGSQSVPGTYARLRDRKGMLDQLTAQAKVLEKMEEKQRQAEERKALQQERLDQQKELQAERLAAEKQRQDERLTAAKERQQEAAAIKSEKITQQQAMIQRAINGLGGVASAVKSIKELPAGTTTGLLPNLQTKDGMLNYVRNTIGRRISKREEDELNTLFTGIGRNLATIEASGAATGLAKLSEQMQSGVYINAGVDDPYKVALKLADVRRIATENIRPAIDAGVMTKDQKAAAEKLVRRIEESIPFTTVDVIRAGRPVGKKTIGEVTTQAVGRGQPIRGTGTAEDPIKLD
jgi:hypothetical protein